MYDKKLYKISFRVGKDFIAHKKATIEFIRQKTGKTITYSQYCRGCIVVTKLYPKLAKTFKKHLVEYFKKHI